jgi:uncharacterized protein
MTRVLLAVAIGAVAGFVGGMFGVGGGIIVVPGLVLVIKLSQHDAAGTSVAAIVASSAGGVLILAGESEVDWVAAALLTAGGVTGAWVGTRWMHLVPEHVLAGVFTIILFIAAVRMWV